MENNKKKKTTKNKKIQNPRRVRVFNLPTSQSVPLSLDEQ
jgi:hypothetical protein